MTAAFCCVTLDVVPAVRHADYIGLWLNALREDDRAVIRAPSQASKAADYLLRQLSSQGQTAEAAAGAGCFVGRPASQLAAPSSGRTGLIEVKGESEG